MELGNMCFGNSRGEFEVPRGAGFEEELERLFDSYAPKRDKSWREYGEEFQNKTFRVFPYYWGDCTCGFEEADWKWSEENNHSLSCFHSRYREEESKHDILNRHEPMIEWSKANGYAEAPFGMAVHCDCGVDKSYQEWRKANNHKEDCLVEIPNFYHKPSGYKLKWYKYPLRDSYANQDLSLDEFRAIINDSIKSVASETSNAT